MHLSEHSGPRAVRGRGDPETNRGPPLALLATALAGRLGSRLRGWLLRLLGHACEFQFLRRESPATAGLLLQ